MKCKAYLHTAKIGDLIYALPALKVEQQRIAKKGMEMLIVCSKKEVSDGLYELFKREGVAVIHLSEALHCCNGIRIHLDKSYEDMILFLQNKVRSHRCHIQNLFREL